MPTTPNGTVYTTTTFTNALGEQSLFAVADAVRNNPNLRSVGWAHGAAGTYNQLMTLSALNAFRDRCLDAGIVVWEGLGGGSQPWGNQRSQDSYDATFDHVDSVLDIGQVVVIGRSMGGVVMVRMYLDRRGSDLRFKGVVVNSGVQDLDWAYDWDGGRWTAAFNSAWGVTSKAGFQAASVGMNPVDGPASRWDGANVLQMWGDADPLVPAQYNASVMRAMYAGHPAINQYDINPNGDHSTTNGSYKRVDEMMNFIDLVTGVTPPPEPGALPSFKVIRRYLMLLDGKSHLVRPIPNRF